MFIKVTKTSSDSSLFFLERESCIYLIGQNFALDFIFVDETFNMLSSHKGFAYLILAK